MQESDDTRLYPKSRSEDRRLSGLWKATMAEKVLTPSMPSWRTVPKANYPLWRWDEEVSTRRVICSPLSRCMGLQHSLLTTLTIRSCSVSTPNSIRCRLCSSIVSKENLFGLVCDLMCNVRLGCPECQILYPKSDSFEVSKLRPVDTSYYKRSKLTKRKYHFDLVRFFM